MLEPGAVREVQVSSGAGSRVLPGGGQSGPQRSPPRLAAFGGLWSALRGGGTFARRA